jgi:hypothetical protein
MSVTQNPNDFTFAYDLTLDEARRRTAVLEAIGDDWDPIQVLAEEELAWDMLYSNAGVLPDRAVNRVAD